MFLLRFIWTFNKFDDIFLLTGGNAGTRTLTVNVYEQAFAVSNLGAGAAVAVIIFLFLLIFSTFLLNFLKRKVFKMFWKNGIFCSFLVGFIWGDSGKLFLQSWLF